MIINQIKKKEKTGQSCCHRENVLLHFSTALPYRAFPHTIHTIEVLLSEWLHLAIFWPQLQLRGFPQLSPFSFPLEAMLLLKPNKTIVAEMNDSECSTGWHCHFRDLGFLLMGFKICFAHVFLKIWVHLLSEGKQRMYEFTQTCTNVFIIDSKLENPPATLAQQYSVCILKCSWLTMAARSMFEFNGWKLKGKKMQIPSQK